MSVTHHPVRRTDQLAASFLTGHRAVGLLGFFLPASLLAWSLLSGRGIRGSLSEYYYSPVRDILVGTLVALALFLWAFRGYSASHEDLVADRTVAKVAAVAALLLALSPVNPRQEGECTVIQCVAGTRAADAVHAVAAVVFFTALTAFCLVLFPRSAIPGRGLGRRLAVYRSCGWTIMVSLLLIVVWKFLPVDVFFALGRFRPIFWLEAIAVSAFAFAWTVRGRAIQTAVTSSVDEV